MLTDTACLTDAILRPRDRNSACKYGARKDVDDQNQAEQYETRGPSLPLPVFVRRNRVNVNHVRQRFDGLIPAGTPIAIAESGEKQRGSFTGDAGEREKNCRENASIGRRDDNCVDRLPFAGAERHRAFPERVGNSAHEVFGAAQRDGNHHDAEGDAAGERGEMFERQNDERVSEDADDDRRHAVEQVGGVADDESDWAGAEFGEVDGAEEADGNADKGGEKQELGAADDGVGHAAAGFADRSGELGEEVPVDRGAAVVDEIAEDEEEDGDGDEGAKAGHGEHEGAYEFAPAETWTHECAPPRCE